MANKNKGRPLTEAHRRAVSEARVGRRLTEAHREAIRRGHLDKPLSPEHKLAISEGVRRSWQRRREAKLQKDQETLGALLDRLASLADTVERLENGTAAARQREEEQA